MLKLQRGPDHVVGDRRHREWPDNSPSGFNGAPTTWSGIEGAFGVVPFPVTKLQRGPDHVVRDRPQVGRPDLAGTGFNGAPTTWSGIACQPAPNAPVPAASTGPRPRGRGSVQFP